MVSDLGVRIDLQLTMDDHVASVLVKAAPAMLGLQMSDTRHDNIARRCLCQQ